MILTRASQFLTETFRSLPRETCATSTSKTMTSKKIIWILLNDSPMWEPLFLWARANAWKKYDKTRTAARR